MADVKTIGRLNRLFLHEKIVTEARDKTPEAAELKELRRELMEWLQRIGKSGDLDLIVAAERRFLENDLTQYANSGAMAASLGKALEDMAITEKLVEKVRDPEAYRSVDQSFARSNNRVGGVPRDEARQFFRSHDTRLTNMDRSRLADEEKAIVDERKRNIRIGEKVYISLQQKALGIVPTQTRDPGLSR